MRKLKKTTVIENNFQRVIPFQKEYISENSLLCLIIFFTFGSTAGRQIDEPDVIIH